MNQFVEMNPGLKSRFDKTYVFKDYDKDQLLAIAENLFKKEGLTPNVEALTHLGNYLNFLIEKKDKFFGNARTVRQIVGDCVMKQNLRMASIPKELRLPKDILILTLDDVKHLVIDESTPKQNLGYRFGS